MDTFENTRATVEQANADALDAWARAARHLGLAIEAIRLGCDWRDEGFKARKKWLQLARKQGASSADALEDSRRLPVVELPALLKELSRRGRALEVLQRELAEQDAKS